MLPLTVCLKTVTALWYGSLKVFALALCEAMEQGKRYLLRTAAFPGKGNGRNLNM